MSWFVKSWASWVNYQSCWIRRNWGGVLERKLMPRQRKLNSKQRDKPWQPASTVTSLFTHSWGSTSGSRPSWASSAPSASGLGGTNTHNLLVNLAEGWGHRWSRSAPPAQEGVRPPSGSFVHNLTLCCCLLENHHSAGLFVLDPDSPHQLSDLTDCINYTF